MDQDQLRALFEQARRNQDVMRAISVPATSRPWYKFKPLCVDAAQVAVIRTRVGRNIKGVADAAVAVDLRRAAGQRTLDVERVTAHVRSAQQDAVVR